MSKMLVALSRTLWSSNGGVAFRTVQRSHSLRGLISTAGSKDKEDRGPTDSQPIKEDDEYLMEGFETEDGEEDIESVMDALNKSEDEITPELASHLVERMVQATKKKIERPGGNIVPYISAHTVSVMRASRITTNNIQAAGSDYLPHAIEKKVTAEVNVELLGLSRTAREALRILSGPRWKGSYIKISCNHYPSMEENRVHIVSQIDRLVKAAKTSVGEAVDTKPLMEWSEVVDEVKNQALEEIKEAGNVSLVLGESKE